MKVFDTKHCAQQLPILANSDFNNYRDLMHRSVSDLSLNLMISEDPMLTQHLAMELHKEQVQVKDIHARMMDKKVILLMILSNNRVIAYEGLNDFKGSKKERFRFKII